MNRKRGGFIAVLLAFALVVAACGDDDADTTTEATEAPTTTAAAVTTTEATATTEPTAAGLVTLEEVCATYDGLQAPDGFRANLVTDIGKIDDGTFNQFAYDGLAGALTCFGIEDLQTQNPQFHKSHVYQVYAT